MFGKFQNLAKLEDFRQCFLHGNETIIGSMNLLLQAVPYNIVRLFTTEYKVYYYLT